MERFLVQARLVLWQRVAVQTLRRHWLASAFEVLATVACFTQVSRLAPVPSELGNFSSAKLFPAHFAFPGQWPSAVVYQPPSAYADELLASYIKRKDVIQKTQVWIDTQHLTLIDRNARIKKEWYSVYTRQFPQTALPLDNRGYREKVLLFLALSFSVPFCLRVSSVVSESASGLRFVMQLSGLLEAAYWFGQLAVGVLMGGASSAIVLLFMTLPGSEGTTYFLSEGLEAGPLVVTFLLFSCLFTLHALLVASLFRTASVAVTFAIIYWFPIMLFAPWQMIEGYESPLGGYLYAPRNLKLLSSATPCLGIYWILKIVGLSLDYEGQVKTVWTCSSAQIPNSNGDVSGHQPCTNHGQSTHAILNSLQKNACGRKCRTAYGRS